MSAVRFGAFRPPVGNGARFPTIEGYPQDTLWDDFTWSGGGGMPGGPMPTGPTAGFNPTGGNGHNGGGGWLPPIPGLPGGLEEWIDWGASMISGCPPGTVRVPPIIGPCRGSDPYGGAPGAAPPPPQQRNGFQGQVAIACPSGYRPNKSDYFLRSGQFVPKGTRCVKSRRRNPLNPRALDRAISRVSSAKKAAAKLSRITIRKRKC